MSDRYMRLKNRLEDGEFVILDGGVGTELEKRGVEMDAGGGSVRYTCGYNV